MKRRTGSFTRKDKENLFHIDPYSVFNRCDGHVSSKIARWDATALIGGTAVVILILVSISLPE